MSGAPSLVPLPTGGSGSDDTTQPLVSYAVAHCPVCNAHYGHPGREGKYAPVTRSCGHTTCQACVDTLPDVCAVCRLKYEVCAVNVSLADLAEAKWEDESCEDESGPYCEDCAQLYKRQTRADGHCTGETCSARPLCTDHAAPHMKWGHSFVRLPKATATPVPTSPLCPRHPQRELTHYCVTEKCPVCPECVRLDHSSGTHEIVSLESVVFTSREKLSRLGQACVEHAQLAAGYVRVVQDATRRLELTHERQLVELNNHWQEVKARLDALFKRTSQQCVDAMKGARKALDAQQGELEVRWGQLLAAREIAMAGLRSVSSVDVITAAVNVESMMCMTTESVFEGPVVNHVPSVWLSDDVLLSAMRECVVLRRYGENVGVDVGLSEAMGAGLDAFVSGDSSANVIDVTARDVEGRLLTDLSVDDVMIDAYRVKDGVGVLEGQSVLLNRVVSLIGPGRVRINYDVFDVSVIGLKVSVIGLKVSVCGVPLALGVGGECVRVVRGQSLKDIELARLRAEHSGCRVRGLYDGEHKGGEEQPLTTQLIEPVKVFTTKATHCCGMAVNSSETIMAVTCWNTSSLYVYGLPDGELIKNVGGLTNPGRVCFGPNDSILVADLHGSRIVEYYNTYAGKGGNEKRVLNSPGGKPFAICYKNDLIGVSNHSGNSIWLLHYVEGTLKVEIKGLPNQAQGLCFTNDGTALCAIQSSGVVTLFCVTDGRYLRQVCPGIASSEHKLHNNLIFTPGGDAIVAAYEKDHVTVFDGVSTPKLRFGGSGADAGQFKNPSALSYVNGRLYVSEGDKTRVQVFEME